ncbi:MAG: chorismate lyase [Motiliproteus sp.]
MIVLNSLSRQHLAVRWRSYRRVPGRLLPGHWLLDSGSLTARLVALSGGDFRVEVVAQGWERPNISEALALQIDPRLKVLVREVRLLGCGQVWVHARSLIPATTLTGRHRKLATLGSRPLGEVLFTDPGMQRGAIETARVPLYSPASRAWARRSVFYLDHKPLLVSEVFLPQLLQLQ